jgi:hypothetical protein
MESSVFKSINPANVSKYGPFDIRQMPGGKSHLSVRKRGKGGIIAKEILNHKDTKESTKGTKEEGNRLKSGNRYSVDPDL